MQSPSETILLFGLSDAETTLVKRLVSSFEIEIVPLTIGTVRNFVQRFPEKKICLIIFSVDVQQKRQDRVIQLIRDFVGPFIPFLLLIPKKQTKDLRKYLNAGADDFMELPLNEERFSIGFLILLEMGQALISPEKAPPLSNGDTRRRSRDVVNRLVAYFREGLSYFAPKSLIISARTERISDKWQQVRKLGAGGFGEVWLVKEIGSGRMAVAKTPSLSRDEYQGITFGRHPEEADPPSQYRPFIRNRQR